MAIEPKTGRILAMVSTPSYDPNQLASHDMSQANSNYGVLSMARIRPVFGSMATAAPSVLPRLLYAAC